MEKLISYYPEGIMKKKVGVNYPEKFINFNELIDIMRSKELKEKINELRQYKYKGYTYNYKKKSLPVVLFNKFRFNLNSGFVKENPIKPFDVDLTDNTIDEIKLFEKDIKEKALKVIKSPSGKGLKFFLYKKFNVIDSDLYYEKYKNICKKIERKYNIKLDYCQGRIKQPFFLTYINKK